MSGIIVFNNKRGSCHEPARANVFFGFCFVEGNNKNREKASVHGLRLVSPLVSSYRIQEAVSGSSK